MTNPREALVLLRAPTVRASVRRAIRVMGAERGTSTSAIVTILLETHPLVINKLAILPPVSLSSDDPQKGSTIS